MLTDYTKFDELIALCNDSNLLYYPDAFIRMIHSVYLKNGVIQLPYPLFVTWDITNLCNLSCKFCSASASHTNHRIHCPDAMVIAEKIVDSGAVYVSLRGGEPSLVYELPQVVAFFLEEGLFVEIVTNGSYIDDAFFEVIGSFEVSRLRIKISCDSCNAQRNDFVRGRNSHQYATAAMRVCQKKHVHFRVQMVVCSVNKQDIIPTYHMADSMGATSFGTILVIPSGRATATNLRVELDDEIIDQLLYIKKYQNHAVLEKIGLGMQAIHYFKHLLEMQPVTEEESEHLRAMKCNGCKTRIYVDEVGDVYPCELLRYPEMKLGNILEQSLLSLWTSPAATEFNSIRRKDIEGCRDCSYGSCDTGCYALYYENFKKGGSSLPSCELWYHEYL